MNEIDLIKEVEKRPILYDKSLSGFNKTKLRDDAWQEVQEVLLVSGKLREPLLNLLSINDQYYRVFRLQRSRHSFRTNTNGYCSRSRGWMQEALAVVAGLVYQTATHAWRAHALALPLRHEVSAALRWVQRKVRSSLHLTKLLHYKYVSKPLYLPTFLLLALAVTIWRWNTMQLLLNFRVEL